MNIKTILKIAFAFMAFLMVSCNDNGPGTINVPTKVVENLNAMYPNAQNVSWIEKGKYVIAHFNLSQTRYDNKTNSAWFLKEDGSWGMTETEILFNELPETIKTAFNASEYAAHPWEMDNEVDKLTRAEENETIYVIEVEKKEGNIETELDLYYTEDGTLVKTIIDADEDDDYENMVPVEMPETISSWFTQNYPKAKIIETDFDNNIYEIEFVDTDTEIEALFETSGKWILSKTELSLAQIPSNLINALKLTEVFAKYPKIEDIDKYETASVGNFYEFELENELRDIKVYMDESGLLIDKPEIPELKEGISVNESISNIIEQKYPNATIIEKEMEDGFLCIDIKHEGLVKELRFNGKNEWIDSEWDLDVKAVPAIVVNSLKAAYPNAVIDSEVEYFESPKTAHYEFEIYNNNVETEVIITIDGKIIN